MDRYEIIGQFRIIAPKQFNLDHERLLTAAADLLEADAREIETLKSSIKRGREDARAELVEELASGLASLGSESREDWLTDLLRNDAREIETLNSEIERLNDVILANNLRAIGMPEDLVQKAVRECTS